MERSVKGRDSRALSGDDLETLWTRHSKGDGAALGLLFSAVAPVLLRRAAAVTRDHALAEDAVQEAFLDLVRGAHTYDSRRPLLPWLIGVVTRKALKARRCDRRRPDPARLHPASAAELEPRDEPTLAALGKFAEPYRSAALLRWRYDLSPAEVALLRGEPAGTTRSLLSRAIAHLRRIASTIAAFAVVGMGWRWLSGLLRIGTGPQREAAAAVAGASCATAGTKGLVAVAVAGLVGIGSTFFVTTRGDAAASEAEVLAPVSVNLPQEWGWIHRHRPSAGSSDDYPALPG